VAVKQERDRWDVLPLLLILLLGALLRFYGLNWDEGLWLHPDERQIYFVTLDLGWPTSVREFLSPESPLNPHFFAYGSFPFYLLKVVSSLLATVWPAVRDPGNLHLAGRPLAVAFDLGTIYLTYRLARSLGLPDWDGRPRTTGFERSVALAAAALVSVAVLHVQLAHFYTVDPLLVFLILLALNLAADVARGAGWRSQVALGFACGLALATKINAALLIVVVFAAFNARPVVSGDPSSKPAAAWAFVFRQMVPTCVVAAGVFLLAEPYALLDWRTFLEQTARESQIAWGGLDVPYTLQYAGTLPYLYSIWQLLFWGVGPPLGVAIWGSLAIALLRWLRSGSLAGTMILAWAIPYFAITGALYTRYLRYMLPLVPVLCLCVAWGLADIERRHHRRMIYGLLAGTALFYCLAFSSIYTQRHSWISASEWIYRNIPAGSALAVEAWDTPLPLAIDVDGRARRIEEYELRTLPLYDEPDDVSKWGPIAADLAGSDYLIIASRRLYGSIPRSPERYPVTTRFYERLFAGQLGFELTKEFTRGPSWLNPRLPPLPDAAPGLLQPDESVVVYDHPRALILRNAERLPAEELLRRLQ
jgi:hypothetical protein